MFHSIARWHLISTCLIGVFTNNIQNALVDLRWAGHVQVVTPTWHYPQPRFFGRDKKFDLLDWQSCTERSIFGALFFPRRSAT